MRLHAFSPLFALLLTACGAHAGSYIVEAAPQWVPMPTPSPALSPVAEASAVSTTAAIAPAPKRHKKGVQETATPTATETPTLTPTATPRSGFYLVPFQDKRQNQELWSGRSMYERVFIEPAGATLLAGVWRKRPYGDMAYLWHRQYAYDLADSGFNVKAASLPQPDEKAALDDAKEAGAKFLLDGTITRLEMVKKGADALFGTNFKGTNYYFDLEVKVRVLDVATGKPVLETKPSFQRVFYDPTRLGSDDRDTFPRFFATGFPELVLKVVGEEKLRSLAGLPTFTATPTGTNTPEAHLAPEKDGPTPVPTATPDEGPYWVNPKTGNKVDPAWNFDPADGTPRDKFILHKGVSK